MKTPCNCTRSSLEIKCEQCNPISKLNAPTQRPTIDRWQSRYLDNVIGIENLTSPVEQEHDKLIITPVGNNTPLMKRMSKPFSNLLDSRHISLINARLHPAKVACDSPQMRNSCAKCNKKLKGKTVRLPESQIKYHWDCLTCYKCQMPFDTTSFLVDSTKNIYHPECSPLVPVIQSCTRCSLNISDNYLIINASTLHPRCFRCISCQKILHPSSIYTEKNGAYCQQCTVKELPNDKEILSNLLRIVPHPQSVGTIPSSNFQNSKSNISFPGDKSRVSSPSLGSPRVYPVHSLPGSPSLHTTGVYPLRSDSIESVKPSTLMSSRGKPLPRFGIVRDCPGCNLRINSFHDEIPGPKAARWHKKCLVCRGCSKGLDSGATVMKSAECLEPWCTTCLVSI
ncbi:hypothetical protein BDB01DRAFT_874382 [Pilobolus umbonatus]|nr:hypothetical protein BDB01DRAFT_874382 [Pilobolus umbonatus]